MSIHWSVPRDASSAVVDLVRRRYSQRGFSAPSQDAASRTVNDIVLEARAADQCIGTMTIRFDEPIGGLHADATFPTEVDRLRGPGRRLCEFGRLALDLKNNRAKEALALLFHVGYIIAYRRRHATHLVIEVHPRHAFFYRRRLGFGLAGAQRDCPRVGAPAVLLYRTLRDLAGDVTRFGGLHLARNRSFYAFGLTPWEENDVAMCVDRGLASVAAEQPQEVIA